MKLAFFLWIFHLFSPNLAAKAPIIDNYDENHIIRTAKQLKAGDVIYKEAQDAKSDLPPFGGKCPRVVNSKIIHPKTTDSESIRNPFNDLVCESIMKASKIDMDHVIVFLRDKYQEDQEIKDYSSTIRGKKFSLLPEGIILFQFLKTHFRTFKKENPNLGKNYFYYKFTFYVLEKYDFSGDSFLIFLGLKTTIIRGGLKDKKIKICHLAYLFDQLVTDLLGEKIKVVEPQKEKGQKFRHQGGYFIVLSLLRDIIEDKRFKEFKTIEESLADQTGNNLNLSKIVPPGSNRLQTAFWIALSLNHISFKERLDKYCKTKQFEKYSLELDFRPLFDDLKEIYCQRYFPLGETSKHSSRAVIIKPMSKLVAEIIKSELNISYVEFLKERLGFNLLVNIEERGPHIEVTGNIADIFFSGLLKLLDLQESNPILNHLRPYTTKTSLFTSMRGLFMLLQVYHQIFRGKEGPMTIRVANTEPQLQTGSKQESSKDQNRTSAKTTKIANYIEPQLPKSPMTIRVANPEPQLQTGSKQESSEDQNQTSAKTTKIANYIEPQLPKSKKRKTFKTRSRGGSKKRREENFENQEPIPSLHQSEASCGTVQPTSPIHQTTPFSPAPHTPRSHNHPKHLTSCTNSTTTAPPHTAEDTLDVVKVKDNVNELNQISSKIQDKTEDLNTNKVIDIEDAIDFWTRSSLTAGQKEDNQYSFEDQTGEDSLSLLGTNFSF